MTEIKQLLVDNVLHFIDSIAVKARVTIDGVDIMKDVYVTKNDGVTLRKYIYLEKERGLVTRAALTDVEGRELYVKDNLNYEKGAQGYMIVFPITQKIEGVK